MSSRRRSVAFITIVAGAMGAILGGIGTLLQTVAGGAPGYLLPIVLVGSSVVGALGGLAGAAVVLTLRRARGGVPLADGSHRDLIFVGTFLASSIVYLLGFAWQNGQSPAVMIGIPAVVVGIAIMLCLGVSDLSKRATSIQFRVVSSIGAAFVAAALGLAITVWVSVAAVPFEMGALDS